MKEPKRYSCGNGEGMFEDDKNGHWVEYSEHKAIVEALTEQLRKHAVVGRSEQLPCDVLADGLSLIQAKYAAMIEGKKIRHRSFMDNEYLYYKNGCWFTQDDYQMPEVCFLNDQEQGWWNDGWSVVSSLKNSQ